MYAFILQKCNCFTGFSHFGQCLFVLINLYTFDGPGLNYFACSIFVNNLLNKMYYLLQDGDEYKLADPICTFVFSILVIITTVRVLRDTLHVVMEGKCICFTCTLKLCQLLMSCHYSVLPSVALCVCNTMPMYGQ